MTGENGKYITWYAGVGIVLALMAFMGGYQEWQWSAHEARPQQGTATQAEFIRLSDLFRQDIMRQADQAKDGRQKIEVQLQNVEDKIDALQIAVGQIRG